MLRIPIEKTDELFDLIEKSYRLYIPAKEPSGAVFRERKSGDVFSESVVTLKSPKDLFFPQTETLMDFKVEGKTIEVIDDRREEEDFAVFGIRSCDAKALTVLDNVFLSEPEDTYYGQRRKHGVLVTFACEKPVETCFCTAFGIDPAEPRGDVVVWTDKGNRYLSAQTEKGEKLLSLIKGLCEEVNETEIDGVKALIRERTERLPLRGLPVEKFGAGKTDEYFERKEWEELSKACLGCGTCTFVCPTCQCYDIRDYKTFSGVQRYRCWDSCMYSEFTKMSAGQPRLTQKERFRQRFMHKLVYYPENNDGLFSCVGCGRCVSKCPSRLNIVTVMKKLGGSGNE